MERSPRFQRPNHIDVSDRSARLTRTAEPRFLAARADAAVPSRLPAIALSALALALLAALTLLTACGGGQPGGGPGGAPGGGPQALPMPITTVTNVSLRDATEYVATVKSRHTTNVMPQVEGVVTRIFVKSGDRVAAGAPLMQIDPEKQRATVLSQEATRKQKQAALNYAHQQLERMQTLYKGGAAPKQQLDEAQSGLDQAQADYDALGAQVREQQVQLGYFRVTAPTAGLVGDIPVRTGDRVVTSTLLTTIDQNDALEVYISVPIERAKDLKMGLPVEVLGDSGQVLVSTQINFIASQVDDQTQQLLVKAPVPNGQTPLRAAQFVRARVVWSTHQGPVVPVLAVTRVNGQFFVFTAGPPTAPPPGTPSPAGAPASSGPPPALVAHQHPVQLGDVIGNDYVVLSGLQPGDRIVSSGVQKLFDGMPIMEMPAAPPGAPGAPGASSGSSGGSAAKPGA